MTSTVDKQLHNKNTELHNDSGENSEKVTSFISTVDIDTRLNELLDDIVKDVEPEGWNGNFLSCEDNNIHKQSIKSLIREVVEQVTPDRCDNTRGNTQNPNNPKYSTKYAKGWNDCISEQRTKLNKILKESK